VRVQPRGCGSQFGPTGKQIRKYRDGLVYIDSNLRGAKLSQSFLDSYQNFFIDPGVTKASLVSGDWARRVPAVRRTVHTQHLQRRSKDAVMLGTCTLVTPSEISYMIQYLRICSMFNHVIQSAAVEH
jgi:hypothetical protein